MIITDASARLNLVRIALGLILLHRYGSNAVALLYLPASRQQVVALAFELISACLLTIGLGTPLAALGLFLFQQAADRILLSWSLGSMVLQMVLLPMALLPAGTRWSVDACFNDSAFLRKLYGLWGNPSTERAAALRLMAFVSYGAVSLSALTIPPGRPTLAHRPFTGVRFHKSVLQSSRGQHQSVRRSLARLGAVRVTSDYSSHVVLGATHAPAGAVISNRTDVCRGARGALLHTLGRVPQSGLAAGTRS